MRGGWDWEWWVRIESIVQSAEGLGWDTRGQVLEQAVEKRFPMT
jgi:hypothetical protein